MLSALCLVALAGCAEHTLRAVLQATQGFTLQCAHGILQRTQIPRDGVGSWGFPAVLSPTGQALGAAQLLFKQL